MNELFNHRTARALLKRVLIIPAHALACQVLFCVIMSAPGCRETGNPAKCVSDTQGVIFPCSAMGYPQGCWTPQHNDALKADEIMRRHIQTRAADQNMKRDLVRNGLREYVRQYIGVSGGNGEKLVRVNCMHRHIAQTLDWKRHPVAVRGGGHHYCTATINVATEECVEFSIGGSR